jgi:hypothetical protein
VNDSCSCESLIVVPLFESQSQQTQRRQMHGEARTRAMAGATFRFAL